MAPAIAKTDRRAPIDVLALIDHFAQGGAETLLARFALAAPAVGVRVQIACLTDRDGNPAAAPLIDAGVPPVNLQLDDRVDPSWILRVRRHLQTVRPQVLHTHLGTSDLVGAFAGRSLGIPVVSTIHTSVWTRRVDRVQRRLTLPLQSRVIAVSEEARHVYLRHGLGLPSRVVTVHNGVDLPPAPGAGIAIRRQLGLSAEDLVLVMLSALRPEKGHLIALAALGSLRDRFPNLRLLLVGGGPYEETIRTAAAALGEAVVFAGVRTDVMRVLDAADICLQPSLHEAFPTAIIEAMAAAVPVIATNTGGVPEIITSEAVGRLISAPPQPAELARAIADLLDAPQRRREIAAAARHSYAQRFTAGPWLSRTRAVYDGLLRGGPA